MLTNEQWNNIENGDTLVTAGGSLFYVVSKIKDGRRDYCVVRRFNGQRLREVYRDSRYEIVDVDKG